MQSPHASLARARHVHRSGLARGWALAAALTLSAGAGAGDGQRTALVPLLPRYQQECAACHVAYPPALLAAHSWTRVMTNLDKHFGTDASLDAATVKELSSWLDAHAGTYRKVREAPPENRITRSAWFVREHRGIAADVWKRPTIASAANCNACHTTAAEGHFGERDIRIPR